MIGKKINQLATELAPASTDLTIIGDPISGVSKKITIAQLGAIFSGAVSFYDNFAAFPATGDINVIYCAKDTKKLYLWSGSAYVEVFPSQALLDTYQLRSEKGNANGYASLDSGGKVPISQLPSSIMEYKGTWNAATNTPTLANGTGDTGDVYICNVAGTVNFGAGPLTFAVGDYVIYSGSIWQRSSGAVGTVTSVAVSRSGDALAITGSPITTSGTINIGFAGNSTQYVNGAGNLVTFPGIINEAQNLITEVYNKTGATLTKGTVVYINGGQGNLPSVTKALATGDSTSAQTYGIVRNDITNNNNGYVVVAGRISDLDTQTYTEGTQLYLSPTTAGTYTSTKPYAPNHLVYVGIVVRAHPTQGVVEVKIQNGYELDELHNVAAQTPTNNDGLFWESATNLWKNKSISTILGGTPITGSGNINAIPKFTATNVLGNSVIEDDGSFVSMRGLKINATAGTGNTINFQQGSGVTAAGLGYSTIGASSTTGFVFYIDQNTTSRAFVFDTSTITSDTARTYSMPNSNGTLALVSQLTSGTVTSVAALTIGTTGTDITSTVANSTTTPVITLNVPTASATNRGALSSADWTTFNNKQNTLTNPVTGTGTTNYIAKFTGTSTIGNSLVFDNGTNVGIGTNSPTFLLDVNGTLSASANVTGTDNVAVFHNTNTTTAGTPVIALSTASTGIDAPADIRLAGTNTKGIRIYAADSTLTSTPLGAGFQMFSVSSTNFPGQMFFDSGANNNAFIAFRTTVTSGTISERMRITASGNVGIGTTSPLQKLHVYNSASSSAAIFQGSSNSYIQLGVTNESYIGNVSGALLLETGGSTRLTVSSAGNVGIGETNPTTKLSIAVANSGTNQGGLDITNKANASFNVSLRTDITELTAGGTGNMVFSNSAERMRITSGGGIKISAGSPPTSGDGLEMWYNGTNSVIGSIERSTGTNKQLYFFGSNTIFENGGSERMRITSGGNVRIVGGGDLEIYPASGSSYTAMYNDNDNFSIWNNGSERLRITSGGNVGIGTTSPGSYALATEYGVSASAVISIKNSSASGYSGAHLLNNSGSLMGHFGYANASTGAPLTDSVYFGSIASKAVIFTTNDTERMRILSNGITLIYSVYSQTSGAAANVIVGSDGNLFRSTSSLKYKKNVENYTKGLSEVMKLRAVTYNGINLLDGNKQYAGLIAEEVHALGLTEFVQYANDGTPDALSYQNMVALLVKGMQELKAELDTLKNK